MKKSKKVKLKSRRRRWTIDCRTDNAFQFAIKNVARKALSTEYPFEYQQFFVRVAFMNITEAVMRVQSIPKLLNDRYYILSKYFENGINEIYKIYNKLMSTATKEKLAELDSDVVYQNITHIDMKNKYDYYNIDHEHIQKIMRNKKCSDPLEDTVRIYSYPGIKVLSYERNFHSEDAPNISVNMIPTGDIEVFLPDNFFRFLFLTGMVNPNVHIMGNKIPPTLHEIVDLYDGFVVPYMESPDAPYDHLMRIPDKVKFSSLENMIKNLVNRKDYKIIEAGMIAYRLGKTEDILIPTFASLTNDKVPVNIFLELNARGEIVNNFEKLAYLKEVADLKYLNIRTHYVNDIKVHSKIMYFKIKNQKTSNVETLSIISTGNFNCDTADSYKDYIYLSFSNSIAHYTKNVFDTIFNSAQPIISSVSSLIKSEILTEIEKGEYGRIWILCNHIDDEDIVSLLKEAVARKVDVRLIIRTTKCFSSKDNIPCKCVTGALLQHERSFIFGSSFPGSRRIYISSSDLLYRNLYKRFESIIRIESNICMDLVENDFNNLWASKSDNVVFTHR